MIRPAWWQLLRAANVFTAVSNVLAGFLLVQGTWQPVGALVCLIAASVCLYEAGMVLNDVFDAELDAVERPERPIPSGKIAWRTAAIVGASLLAGGVFFGFLAAWQLGRFAPAAVTVLLAIAILTYDALLKPTVLAPYAMGLCRSLNVLLGASILPLLWPAVGAWWFAAGVGIYTVGLTLLAQHEVGENKPPGLLPYLFVLGGLLAIAQIPVEVHGQIEQSAWWWLCTALLLLLFAILSPRKHTSALEVRSTVKRLILFFIVIDATVALAATGWLSGLAVLALLIPTLLASRRIAMT